VAAKKEFETITKDIEVKMDLMVVIAFLAMATLLKMINGLLLVVERKAY